MKFTSKGILATAALGLLILAVFMLISRACKREGIPITHTPEHVAGVTVQPPAEIEDPGGAAVEKDVVIAELQATIEGLRQAGAEKDARLAALSARLRQVDRSYRDAKQELIQYSQVAVRTEIRDTAPIVERPIDTTQSDFGRILEAVAETPWYKVGAVFSVADSTAQFDLNVRNEFEIHEFQDVDGGRKVRVVNKNPYTYTPETLDVFRLQPLDKAPPERIKARRFNLGVSLGVAAVYADKGIRAGPGVGAGLTINLIR